jgi:hypothetical protein
MTTDCVDGKASVAMSTIRRGKVDANVVRVGRGAVAACAIKDLASHVSRSIKALQRPICASIGTVRAPAHPLMRDGIST